MTPGLRRTLLAVYIAIAAGVFLYLGFPAEALRAYAGERLSASLPGLSVAVGAVRPSLRAGLVLQEVRISHGQKLVAVLDRVLIRPEILSLFQERSAWAFSGSLAGGDLSGRAELDVSGPTPKVQLNARIAGTRIEEVAGLRSLYGSRLSGRLDGTLTHATATGVVNGKLTITEGQVELATPVFAQSRFTFRTADADLVWQHQSLLLRNGRLKGNELDADLSGSIALDQPQAAGALNLTGRVTPHHVFLTRAEGSLPPGLLRRRAGIPFRISGPLDAPGVSLN